MSKVSEFYEAFSKDEAMQERAKARIEAFNEAGKQAKAEAIIAFAEEEGYTFTAEELIEFSNRELSDEELQAVAGGLDPAYDKGEC
ncbi:MAG: Nif11-like leader peptide family RiPP precursor [Clostridiales Family XIII bacterium]|nr:Nif11-like leader peptide family RiPP precursor [Clostridiales Family XIII bacterium]